MNLPKGLPNRLKVRNGELEMLDGTDVKTYLKANAYLEDKEVVVVTREAALQLLNDARAYRELMDHRFALAA